MPDYEFQMTGDWAATILALPGVRPLLASTAEAVAAAARAANPDDAPFIHAGLRARTRIPTAGVVNAHPQAMLHESRTGALARALRGHTFNPKPRIES